MSVSPGAGRRGDDAALEARLATIAETGRRLVDNADARVLHEPPFLLSCECRGDALDLAIRRVSTFAFALSAIISAIVLSRAAPWPIGGIALFWVGAGVAARLFARARRRQHGTSVIDFETDRLLHTDVDGRASEHPLGPGCKVLVETSVDEAAPFWIVLVDRDGRWLRLARGTAEELRRVVQLFRSYNLDVNASALEETSAEAVDD